MCTGLYRAFNFLILPPVRLKLRVDYSPMDKDNFAKLIDAYADAKSSKNQHLIGVMVSQIKQALDMVFPEAEETQETEDGKF